MSNHSSTSGAVSKDIWLSNIWCDLKYHCGKQISIGRLKQVFPEMCSKTFHFNSCQSWQPGYRGGHGDSPEKLTKTVLVFEV